MMKGTGTHYHIEGAVWVGDVFCIPDFEFNIFSSVPLPFGQTDHFRRQVNPTNLSFRCSVTNFSNSPAGPASNIENRLIWLWSYLFDYLILKSTKPPGSVSFIVMTSPIVKVFSNARFVDCCHDQVLRKLLTVFYVTVLQPTESGLHPCL